MKALLLLALLAFPVRAENVTITLPNGTTASVPGTGPATSAEAILAAWITSKVDTLQRDDFYQAALLAAKNLPPARRALMLKAIQKIGTTTVGGLQTISNAVDGAP